jgi:predicted DNA-binding transcriptional regulator YafY
MTTATGSQTAQREIRIRYRNWRGETSVRRILPGHIWFGANEWHNQNQWLLDAIDLDRNEPRSFAVKDILEFDVTEG